MLVLYCPFRLPWQEEETVVRKLCAYVNTEEVRVRVTYNHNSSTFVRASVRKSLQQHCKFICAIYGSMQVAPSQMSSGYSLQVLSSKGCLCIISTSHNHQLVIINSVSLWVQFIRVVQENMLIINLANLIQGCSHQISGGQVTSSSVCVST